MGFSQHAGMVIVADGTPEAARRLARVLRNDPGTGVMRHADAGYEIAVECAKEEGLDLPMLAPLAVAACDLDGLSQGLKLTRRSRTRHWPRLSSLVANCALS